LERKGFGEVLSSLEHAIEGDCGTSVSVSLLNFLAYNLTVCYAMCSRHDVSPSPEAQSSSDGNPYWNLLVPIGTFRTMKNQLNVSNILL
jgi:hypothetical protein